MFLLDLERVQFLNANLDKISDIISQSNKKFHFSFEERKKIFYNHRFEENFGVDILQNLIQMA